VIPGVALVVGGIPGSMQLGFWVGVVSAALARGVQRTEQTIPGPPRCDGGDLVELGAGFLLVAAISPFAAPDGVERVSGLQSGRGVAAVLAILCTLIPFAVSLATLRHLSAFTAQLAINLEPVYAIGIAVLFLGEARDLDVLFFLGVVIVAGRRFWPRMAANAGIPSYQ
jgi:drug/metabolite transporter (DMT)-like permease